MTSTPLQSAQDGDAPRTHFTTLISVSQLQALSSQLGNFMVFDCTFDLMNPGSGQAEYANAHIPGAVYADLDGALSRHAADKDIAGKGIADNDTAGAEASGGRHPLPDRDAFAAWLASLGFGNDMQAVVYDRNGNNFCGRLWWLLKWAGHDAVAVLDGGWKAWLAAGGASSAEITPARPATSFAVGAPKRDYVRAADIAAHLSRPAFTLVDARGAPRYRGEVEPIDPVAGHIPGALNRPFTSNFMPDGTFKSPEALREEFNAMLADGSQNRVGRQVVHYCGSGVSAVPNIIAMELAGLGQAPLYAGGWSEWCADPARPTVKS